jgi:hypothetical protein
VVYMHEEDERSYDLYMVKVPEEFQPAKVYYLEGTVTNLPAKALVKATDVATGEELARLILDPAEKTFGVYLPEGHQVDFYIETKEQGYGYYSDFLDLEEMRSSQKVTKDITLPTLKGGAQYPVSIAFAPHSAEFAAGAEEEFARLITLMKQNRAFRFQLEVYQQRVTESEQYADSLPEIRYDTILVAPNQLDSLAVDTTALQQMDTIATDATNVFEEDSTAAVQGPMEEVVTIYHNDLTQKRADAIKSYLLGKGVPENMFSTAGMGENPDLDYSDSEKAHNGKVVFRLE